MTKTRPCFEFEILDIGILLEFVIWDLRFEQFHPGKEKAVYSNRVVKGVDHTSLDRQ